jgi:hypothetical protein
MRGRIELTVVDIVLEKLQWPLFWNLYLKAKEKILIKILFNKNPNPIKTKKTDCQIKY